MITILLAFSIISGGKDKTNQKLQPNDETEY
jgi:hypothetical protein